MDKKRRTGLTDKRILRQGRVVDSTGQPVSGALVSIVWGTVQTRDIARRTNHEGRFQVGLEPGRYRIQAVKSDASGEVEVDGGEGSEIVVEIRKR